MGEDACSQRARSQLIAVTEHHLYKMISEYLKSHPTTKETPKKLQIQGLPMPKSFSPDIPRGQKMGSILPPHSPALSGGGVTDDMFKNMVRIPLPEAPEAT